MHDSLVGSIPNLCCGLLCLRDTCIQFHRFRIPHWKGAQPMLREFVVKKGKEKKRKEKVLIQIGRQFKVKGNTRSHIIHTPQWKLE